ncbi:MAG: xanthine dehydrogenase accessory factor [Solirubrobacteraceae bacterium]|jgi:xanthine dehydrogenase accessory factor|nr:xanthine dehydrogenase accessory factor [Solirubrobacteraceae bacterium]
MLAAQGASFVTATVVRAQRPTSVQAGNVALITSDGSIDGFVGGVCAEHSVRLYSLKVLETGEPVLLKILPDADGAEDDDEGPGQELASEEGSVTVQNPCLSGGAIEVFLEPRLPLPRVHLVGSTPIAGAIERLAPELGLKVVTVLRGVLEPLDGDLGLVVAAHGRDELETVQAGLEARLPYVGLVASPKRAAGLIEELRASGVPDDLLAQVEAPAGIPIDAHTPEEIALSILARLVTVRRGGSYVPAAASGPGALAPEIATDPICGMTVAVVADTPRAERDGETFYFCRPACKTEFESQDPAAEEPPAATATGTAPGSAVAPAVAVDPICGMTVVVDADTPQVEHDGETVYFCCAGCKTKFEKEHLHAAAAS